MNSSSKEHWLKRSVNLQNFFQGSCLNLTATGVKMAEPTLRHSLVQEKPAFRCASKNYGTTSVKSWPFLELVEWQEFNLNELNNSYGHILNLPATGPHWDAPVPTAATELGNTAINIDQDILGLIGWNAKLLCTPLRFAKRSMSLYQGIELHHAHSTPDKQLKTTVPGQQQGPHADHIISLNSSPPQNLVAGIGRTSRKFNGAIVLASLAARKELAKRLTWPMRQLANLCRTLDTRYGYMQTDQELVVFRFSRIDHQNENDDHGEENGLVTEWFQAEVKSIPWTTHGEQQLTTDLSLWWLGMLALARSPAIVKRDEMVKINQWDYHGDLRRHHYSGAEIPDPQPVYQIPNNDNDNNVDFGGSYNDHNDNGIDPQLDELLHWPGYE